MLYSIIIPVYNVEQYLRKCLDSVASQTFIGWEAVCVDDGSLDGSGAILDWYARKDKRFKVIHQANAGVVAARQAGFRVSSGERILFLDGDDMLRYDALELMEKVPDSVDYIKFSFSHILDNGEEVAVVRNIITGRYGQKEVLQFSGRSPLEILGMCIWDKCYKRGVAEGAFNAVGNIRIFHSEDGLFALAAFWLSRSFSFIDAPLYNYRFRETSASHTFNSCIVDCKDTFVRVAVEIAKRIGGQSDGRCQMEFNYHSRQSLGYIFMLALDNKVRWNEARSLLVHMSSADFFKKERSSWNPVRHAIMRWLVKWPSLCIMLRSALRIFIKVSIR